MKIRINTFKLAGGAVVCLLCSIIAYQATAQRGMKAPPTSVAVINLAEVLNGLKQRGDADVRLQQMGNEIQNEDTRRKNEITELQATFESVVDPEERMALEERIETMLLDYRVWQQWNLDKFDIERALSWQDLYRSIKDELADLARAEGYDLVFIDDSAGELVINPNSQQSREAQIQQQMKARQLLFVSDAVDVSDDLITRMNNKR